MPYLIEFNDRTGHLEIIGQFFEQTERFLAILFQNPAQYGLAYFSNDVSRAINFAYETERPSTSDIMSRLSSRSENDFQQLGLTGASLRAKAIGLNSLADMMRRGVISAIRWLLGLVNSMLESLGKLTWLADALKELKDLFENSTDFIEGING